MCLAVAGRILSISNHPPEEGRAAKGEEPHGAEDPLWRLAEVDFGGVRQAVSLACLPQAQVGDRVLVHVGLALSLVEEDEP